ncbi:DUF2787 domain-containing protein [Moritella viscosa]|uniref:DUF2787 domain-containing protein n=1 Tax=Moritella viscosa TaxID=80854 RepID=UPI000914B054|nr:DUF2787 domain-containing protein [Moritella viscosa]SHO14508.1 Putative uncharacterized protein [Moritella viscosa]SHO15645.1 Putative uncharacterized protein [Moritella viscosa]SHO19074.1 Putative uncharacterized protein [Moritella viscosa]
MSVLQTTITLNNLIPTLLPISNKLNQCLVNTFNQHDQNSQELSNQLVDTTSIIFNFRDQSYSAQNGGFHPVEICLMKQPNDTWEYAYITDFAYVGSHFPELVKDLDFDFLSGEWFTHYLKGYLRINNNAAAMELYGLWEHNFIAYFDMDVYDNIEITMS